jgi:hypothetical protein
MKYGLLLWTLLASSLLAGSAAAGERAAVNRRTGLLEPPVSDLRKAAERGDRAELARVAGRLGPARLAKALGDGDRRVVQAALDGIPLVDSGILVLADVLPLMAASDPALRAQAVHAVSILFVKHDATSLVEWEIPGETVQAACRALGGLAGKEGEPVATRLSAVQGLLDAGCTAAVKATVLYASTEPEIRRAAVLYLLPDSNDALLAAAKDADERVAAAAGVRLCRRKVTDKTPLHQLAAAPGAAPEDIVDMLPCLTASTDTEDRKAVDELRAHGPAAVREALKR